MSAVGTLWWREMVRFVRQRSRLVGAFGQPLVFWLLLGGGLDASFRPGVGTRDTGYLEYFFPGVIAMVLLFTADLCNDFCGRRSDDGLPPGSSGRTRQAFSDRSWPGTRRHYARHAAGRLISHPRAVRGNCVLAAVRVADSRGDVPRVVRPHGARLDDRMADGIDAGISRGHEPPTCCRSGFSPGPCSRRRGLRCGSPG